jgi:hypothetical protein
MVEVEGDGGLRDDWRLPSQMGEKRNNNLHIGAESTKETRK